jgi:hypothetical protein|eukprot:SAG25_NODE_165_length_13094_cov_31.386149_2_plen_370_part_00
MYWWRNMRDDPQNLYMRAQQLQAYFTRLLGNPSGMLLVLEAALSKPTLPPAHPTIGKQQKQRQQPGMAGAAVGAEIDAGGFAASAGDGEASSESGGADALPRRRAGIISRDSTRESDSDADEDGEGLFGAPLVASQPVTVVPAVATSLWGGGPGQGRAEGEEAWSWRCRTKRSTCLVTQMRRPWTPRLRRRRPVAGGRRRIMAGRARVPTAQAMRSTTPRLWRAAAAAALEEAEEVEEVACRRMRLASSATIRCTKTRALLRRSRPPVRPRQRVVATPCRRRRRWWIWGERGPTWVVHPLGEQISCQNPWSKQCTYSPISTQARGYGTLLTVGSHCLSSTEANHRRVCGRHQQATASCGEKQPDAFRLP